MELTLTSMRAPERPKAGRVPVTITAATLRTRMSCLSMRAPNRPSIEAMACEVKTTCSVSPVPASPTTRP